MWRDGELRWVASGVGGVVVEAKVRRVDRPTQLRLKEVARHAWERARARVRARARARARARVSLGCSSNVSAMYVRVRVPFWSRRSHRDRVRRASRVRVRDRVRDRVRVCTETEREEARKAGGDGAERVEVFEHGGSEVGECLYRREAVEAVEHACGRFVERSRV